MIADVEEVPFPKIPLLSDAKLTVMPATGFPQPSLTVAVTRPAAAAAHKIRAVPAIAAETVNVAVAVKPPPVAVIVATPLIRFRGG